MELYLSFGKKTEAREWKDLSRDTQCSEGSGPGQLQPCAPSAHLGFPVI